MADAIEAEIRAGGPAGAPGTTVPGRSRPAGAVVPEASTRSPARSSRPAVPVVTALAAPRRGVALHVDGRCLARSASRLWRAGAFTRGGSSTTTRSPMRVAALAERVMTDAYRLLGHRARSRFEVETRLRARKATTRSVAGALEQLATDGLLDDAEFARRYVADKRVWVGGGSSASAGAWPRSACPLPSSTRSSTTESGGEEAEFERARCLLDSKARRDAAGGRAAARLSGPSAQGSPRLSRTPRSQRSGPSHRVRLSRRGARRERTWP